ncbi:MAG TPA: class I SAM-dependent methyltransferase [Sphingomonas sp.]|nr:class I SAM-dependent methyltransferase [Sphingomonas sp.]
MNDHAPPLTETAPKRRHVGQRFFPEMGVGGFSHVDGSIAFYSQIAALLKPADRVLDFGAGRGEQIIDDPVAYRRRLVNFKGRCARVDGCDIDPVVRTNPYLDSAEVLTPGEPLPYEDESFDLVVARYVFEHVDDPEWMARELLRITKPGGWICAMTPNSWGYIALAARMVPNRLHARSLRRIQPDRKAEDVFPTRYRMNTRAALRRWFGARADVYAWRASSEPAYHFGSPLIFGAFKLLHKLLPDALQTTLYAFIHKRPASQE